MNTFIETLSLMKRLPPVRQFRLSTPGMLPEGIAAKSFSGQQTNEPQTKYYIWKLAQSKQVVDRIIVIVSRECMNDRIPELDSQTTYEFYRAAILQYLEGFVEENDFFRAWLSENHNGSPAAYLDAVMKPIMIPERMESAEWRGIVDLITKEKEADRLNLYFDFTGGSRVASLISLLLLRVIEEAKDAAVRQIIYSDLQDPNDPKLVDCTGNYAILTSLERIAAAATGDEKVTKIVEELVRLGLEDEKALEGTKEVDSIKNEADYGIRKEAKEKIGKNAAEIGKSLTDASGLAAGVKQKALKQATDKSKESAFATLMRRKDADLIKDFHEEIMGLLLDRNVLTFLEKRNQNRAKERLKELVKANGDYADGVVWTWKEYNKKAGRPESVSYPIGVYPQLLRSIEALDRDPKLTPTEALAELCNLRQKGYKNAMTHRFRWYSPKGFTKENSVQFMRYLKTHGIDELSFDYVELTEMQSIFFNLGFPFVCTLNSEVLPEVSEYYNKLAKALMERLEALQSSDPEAYGKRLKELLTQKGEISAEVPFMVKMSQWSINASRFSSEQEQEVFVKTLCERIEKVRPYRNAIAHNLDTPFRKPLAQKAIAEEIRGWLREYEERFTEKR